MIFALTILYRVILLLLSIYSAIKAKKVDRPTKIICLLIWLGLFTEASAKACILYQGSNYLVYNFSFLLEFSITCLYFHCSVPLLKKKNIVTALIPIGLSVFLTNSALIQPLTTTLSSNFLFFETIVIVILSLLAILMLMRKDDDNLRLHYKTHFWFPCIILFYQCSSIWSLGLYDKLDLPELDSAYILDLIVILINIFTCLSFATLFFLYPKMKRIHV